MSIVNMAYQKLYMLKKRPPTTDPLPRLCAFDLASMPLSSSFLSPSPLIIIPFVQGVGSLKHRNKRMTVSHDRLNS